MLISDENSLWIFIPIMTILTLVGVVLAGVYEDGFFHYSGIALFVVSVLYIFVTLKAYYDARDRRLHSH
jgi:Zn-dependent membrane protease YugP